MAIWHEDPVFWETMGEWLFPPKRVQSAVNEVDWVLERLRLAPPARVLDLCCGPGRHSVELAGRGFDVTGVDRTRSYLDQAKSRADEAGVSVAWIEADMRKYLEPNAFDAALNLFTSFGYFEDPADDERVLDNLFQSLRPGGQLLIDMVGKEVVASHFQEQSWQERDGHFYLAERRIVRDWRFIHNRWILIGPDGRREFEVVHPLYAGSEMAAMVRAAGFREVTLFGDLTGRPYDHQAERLVVVALK